MNDDTYLWPRKPIKKLWKHRNPGICFSPHKTGVRWPMLSICHFGTKGIFILRTFVCNTICVFISQYSGGTNFCHLYCLIWTKLFCFQFQERFSTEDTLWRGLETLGTLICFHGMVSTFENHFGRSSASSCQVNNVRDPPFCWAKSSCSFLYLRHLSQS